jgi:L-serine dehydratase
VQIPCIERNATQTTRSSTPHGSPCAATAVTVCPLDKAIKTMRETDADMTIKYKETSRGGLAVDVIEC